MYFFLDCKTVRIFAIVVRTCDSNERFGASIQNGEWACEARANSHRTMHVFGIKPTVLQSMFVQGRGQRNSLSPRSDVFQVKLDLAIELYAGSRGRLQGPGGYSINYWVGMCRWDSETLSLY